MKKSVFVFLSLVISSIFFAFNNSQAENMDQNIGNSQGASSISIPKGLDVRTARKLARARGRKPNAASLDEVCSSVTPLSGLLIKAEISDHIPGADARATGYSLICGRRCVDFPASFFYCDGSLAAQFGYYGTWNGNGKARAYGASGGVAQHYVSRIQQTARQKSCGGKLFLQTKRKKSECLSFDAKASRTGSPF